ncbi:hypothetical protein DV092_06005 [Clostridium botulinum]|nr:hypothetical protein [Clostridium botulinum]
MKCFLKEECKKCISKREELVFINKIAYPKEENELIIYSYMSKYFDIYKSYLEVKLNDKELIMYLKENYKGDGCYCDIARWIINKTKKYYRIYDEEELNDFILSYLYWSYGNPLDENNLISKEFDKEIILKKVKNKFSKATVKVRTSQKKFRDELIDKYGCCQICGIDEPNLLKASHSKPFSVCNNEESVDVYDGLLLCDKHDGVYDKGYITFDDQGNIIVSDKLSKENIKRLNLTYDIKIELEQEHIKYIKYHRNNIFKK